MQMQRIEVVSSNIKSIGYEEGILEIEFHTGAIYQYDWVPEAEYEDLINAWSVWGYFAKNIKNTYPYTKIS